MIQIVTKQHKRINSICRNNFSYVTPRKQYLSIKSRQINIIKLDKIHKSTARTLYPIYYFIIIITSVNKADVMWSFSVILSFVLSFCKQDNWRTQKRTSTKLGMGKTWPFRSGWVLVMIQICTCIPVFHFLHHWGIGDFPTFVSISLFSQFSCNQQPIWTKLGKMNDADECIHNFGTDIRRTSKFRLMWKSE